MLALNQHPEIVIPGMPHDPHLVFWAPLYELDGISFASKDAYGHLCTRSGSLWMPQGDNLDGTDDNITIVHTTILEPTALTIEIIIKLDVVVGRYNYMVDKSHYPDSGFIFGCDDSGDLSFSYAAGIGWQIVSGAFIPDAGKWYYLAVTHDGTTVVIYRAGRPIKTTAAPVIVWVGSTTFAIGGGLTAGRWSDGQIAEGTIYSRAFSSAEIMQDYLAARRRMPWLT